MDCVDSKFSSFLSFYFICFVNCLSLGLDCPPDKQDMCKLECLVKVNDLLVVRMIVILYTNSTLTLVQHIQNKAG